MRSPNPFMIEAWFDGACEPYNPFGHTSYGLVVKKDGETIYTESNYAGNGPGYSNNVGEYLGIINIFQYLKRNSLNQENIQIYGDSALVINQIQGKWKIKRGIYVEYAKLAKKLSKAFPNTVYQWIPREQNEEADELSKNFSPGRVIKMRDRNRPKSSKSENRGSL